MPENVQPPPDEEPPADPFEAELVAYLDGELDPAAARQVEKRLAADPAARARAAALKKTYELLDYLPQPEPSATFTTRTLDKLPAIRSGSQPVPIPSGTQPSVRPGGSAPAAPAAAVSSSVPVPLGSATYPIPVAASPRRWLVAASVLVVIVALGAIGYLGAAALRPHRDSGSRRDAGLDDLPLSDHRLIERLPLYAAADDLEFVQRLAEPELFGHEAALALEGSAAATGEADKLSGPAFEARAKAFKALPATRQEAIRELDRQLAALDQEPRTRLVRVLEGYAVWLDRLPDSERRGVLGAATPGLRIEVIRDIRERQWLNGLPAAFRGQLAGLSDVRKAEKLRQWKEEEVRQRNLWLFIRRNADAITGVKAPWPFDTETSKKAVINYMQTVFHVDDPKRCRLSVFDLAAYRDALAAAEKNGGWAWYGKAIHDLNRKYETFPGPADSKHLYRDFSDLPPGLAKFAERPNFKRRLTPYAGKWPEFPLELHTELQRVAKFTPGNVPQLGPARVADFTETVRAFWDRELARKLTPAEKSGLQKLENRWPDYPREFVRLARLHDLSIPGVMLPGSPRRWESTYGTGPARGPGGSGRP